MISGIKHKIQSQALRPDFPVHIESNTNTTFINFFPCIQNMSASRCPEIVLPYQTLDSESPFPAHYNPNIKSIIRYKFLKIHIPLFSAMQPGILSRDKQMSTTLQQMKQIDFPVFPFQITVFQISPSIELRKAPPESNPSQPPGLRTAFHQTNVGSTGPSPQLKYLGKTTLIYPFQCLPKRIKHIPGNHWSTYSLQ